MDLSKLPRLSNTPTATPAKSSADPATPAQGATPLQYSARPCPNCGSPLREGARFCDTCGAELVRRPIEDGAGMGAEAWISIGIGILVLLLFPTMTKFVSSKVFHTSFAPYADEKGNPSPEAHMTSTDENGNTKVEIRSYVNTKAGENNPSFWNDLAITSFGLALIVEGIALVLSRRPVVVLFALVVTLSATLLNLVYFVGTYSKAGLAPISVAAVIFGGYMAVYQLRLFQSIVVKSPARK